MDLHPRWARKGRACWPRNALTTHKPRVNAAKSLPGPFTTGRLFKPTVANGALRTWLDLQLALPGRATEAKLASSV